MTRLTTRTILGLFAGLAVVGLAAAVMAQGPSGPGTAPRTTAVTAPRPITMEALHRAGGVPRGWKFTLPKGGDAARGRRAFADLECSKCHRIAGEDFPAGGGAGKEGPELTGMGAHHPPEYFAESILSPNAVLLEGPGYLGPDGRSIMPSYADSLSVTQLLDLVAYLQSQGGGDHAHHDAATPTERVAGPYRVRVSFAASGGGHDHGAGGHAMHMHMHGTSAPALPAASGAGHLVVVVTDAETGEPVPYLPVSAAIEAQGVATKRTKLQPMLADEGFHYGADVMLPPGTQRLVVSIGAATARVMGDAARFAKPQIVAFDWDTHAR